MNISDSFRENVEKLEIPKYPFYGYDNSEEIDKDVDYIKSLYPSDVQLIQREVEEECDKLEYDGSCMFDLYPDRVHLNTIVDKIYDTVSATSEDEVSKEEINNSNIANSPWPWNHCGPNRTCPPPRPDHRPDGRPNWRRDLIESLLFNEMLHRRRRHRSRKRWTNY
ncbi:hypothetical protein [Velocimicrobium porci]|uniref:Uncharacterized protein n=1 Tax=Velocimicrobium porci TaxID=2606634 RepID=A0A6L5XVN2_9FIRM|nr:hypothetical protein [Velocimicrobium porci]MSS62875.1 hypothetical protein [Velocimicrobium porci]